MLFAHLMKINATNISTVICWWKWKPERTNDVKHMLRKVNKKAETSRERDESNANQKKKKNYEPNIWAMDWYQRMFPCSQTTFAFAKKKKNYAICNLSLVLISVGTCMCVYVISARSHASSFFTVSLVPFFASSLIYDTLLMNVTSVFCGS